MQLKHKMGAWVNPVGLTTYRGICELVQGGVIDLRDFFASPGDTRGSGIGSLDQNARYSTGDRGSTRRTLDSPVGPNEPG